jgi:putative endonuclease
MYVGVTSNLERRLAQHKEKSVSGFTAKYRVDRLVYYELTSDVLSAIAREKDVKKWRREKKNRLVESINPQWIELEV